MATLTYTDPSTDYPEAHAEAHDSYHRDIGATAFVWLAWTLAAVFWAAVLSTAFHILATPAPVMSGPDAGEVDAGGAAWGLIEFVGASILGLGIAYGLFRYATRDKRLDPVTEASTSALYDIVERQGGDDMTSRSPEEHSPEERDAYREAVRKRR